MSKDRVVNSVNNEVADRCVDFFVRADGSFGYKEFRRDPEDQGAWTMTAFNAAGVYALYADAVEAASERVVWLREAMARMPPFSP